MAFVVEMRMGTAGYVWAPPVISAIKKKYRVKPSAVS